MAKDILTVEDRLEAAWRAGANDMEAILHADVSKAWYYKYLQEHPDVAERRDKLRKNLTLHSKFNVSKSIIEKGNINDSKWYLEKVDSDFNPKQAQSSIILIDQRKAVESKLREIIDIEKIEVVKGKVVESANEEE